MNDSIRGRYKAEAVFDERRSTAGIEQRRQKDTSGKSGNIKPVHPCTGLTTRFADGKTWLLCRTTAIHGRSDAVDALRFAKASEAIVNKPVAEKVKELLTRHVREYRNSQYPTDVYVDMKDSAEKLKRRAAELSGDAGKQQRIRDKAAQVMQAVNEASSGWIEGSGETGHLGISVVQKETAEAEGSVHDVGYIRGSGAADQCTVVKSSEWWVVQSSKNKSVLDKVFYQYR